MASGAERRQYGRITFEQPLQGWVGETPVEVLEASVTGFRVIHGARFPPGEARQIRIQGGAREMRFSCQVIRSMLFQLAQNAGEKSVYQSGIRIEAALGDSETVLRDLIADHVIRALEEQKANWRGIPPALDYKYQVGKSDRFRRCEWIEGRWRRSDSVTSEQPHTGFTVSADLHPSQVDLLCKTFEGSNDEGRRLTRILAELSIKKTEGTPIRKYEP